MGLLSWLIARQVDKRIANFQNDLMEKHVAEVQHIYKQMRDWRHDYHNHIQKMKAHYHLHQHEAIGDYLNELDRDLTRVDTILKTGKVMVDAILNSKLSLAQKKKIDINAKAVVPKELPFSEVNLCVVLGNLLDNATEACMRVPEGERFIRLYVAVMKGQLYISVSNASGEVKKSGRRFLSAKGAAGGLGLGRIDKIAEGYGGFVNRQHEEGVFVTEVMLPLVG
jgi:sensor histidine kinase regulating citrate/malate metabolism